MSTTESKALVCTSIKRPWHSDTTIFSLLFRLNTKVRDSYLVMRYGLYVVCSVGSSHAKLHMYITLTKSIRLLHILNPVSQRHSIGLAIFLSVAIIRPCTVLHNRLALWHPLDRLDITLPCIYTACLRGRYFTCGCHVAFSLMNARAGSLCFCVRTESASRQTIKYQDCILP